MTTPENHAADKAEALAWLEAVLKDKYTRPMTHKENLEKYGRIFRTVLSAETPQTCEGGEAQGYLIECVTNGSKYFKPTLEIAEYFVSRSEEMKGAKITPLYANPAPRQSVVDVDAIASGIVNAMSPYTLLDKYIGHTIAQKIVKHLHAQGHLQK